MLPIIRFRGHKGTDAIVVFRAASPDPSRSHVNVVEHGDPDPTAYYEMDPAITMDDVQRAVDASLSGGCVATVVGTKHQAPAHGQPVEKE